MEVWKAAILKICFLFTVVLVIGNASETLLDDEEPIETSQNCSDLLHTYLENLQTCSRYFQKVSRYIYFFEKVSRYRYF